jgi:hypothetical protein
VPPGEFHRGFRERAAVLLGAEAVAARLSAGGEPEVAARHGRDPEWEVLTRRRPLGNCCGRGRVDYSEPALATIVGEWRTDGADARTMGGTAAAIVPEEARV